MTRCVAVIVGTLAMAGCGQDFEPPDRALRVEAARAAYSATQFDTIAWATDAERATVGNTVYAEQCSRCHGSLGRGDTEYARGRGLTMPSLVEPDWPRAVLDSVRRAIYGGHESGMPIFAERALTAREIDAAAVYVLETLRPEVLGSR